MSSRISLKTVEITTIQNFVFKDLTLTFYLIIMTYSLIFVLLMCMMIMTMSLVCSDVSLVMAPPQRRRSFGPVSPKRIYRSLSVKLRGGASHDEAEHSDWRRRLSKGPADVKTANTIAHTYTELMLCWLHVCVCVCV